MKNCLPVTIAAFALSLGAIAPAQKLLAIERAKDRAGRDLIHRQLQKIIIKNLFLAEADPEEVVTYLNAAAGEKVGFLFSGRKVKKDDLPKITLKLKSISLANAMAVISNQNDTRFVYRSGVVFMRPKAEVKEHTYLRFYDVRAATFRPPNFPAPKLGLGRGEEAPPDDDVEPGAPVSGFDADGMVDMIRTHVVPESWDSEGVSISQTRGVLAVRHTDSGHEAVRKMLVQLGAAPAKSRLRRSSRRIWRAPKLKTKAKKAAKKPAKKKAGKAPAKKARK